MLNILTVTSIFPKKGYASLGPCIGFTCCSCLDASFPVLTDEFIEAWAQINGYIVVQFFIHRVVWFDQEFFQQHYLPLIQQIAVQMGAVGSQQMMMIGAFMDAKEQMETQRLLQSLHAKANKDYHPSTGMCEFGTRVTTLASSERQGEVNARILSERSTDRLLGNRSAATFTGTSGDLQSRIRQFRSTFCQISDNNRGLSSFCGLPINQEDEAEAIDRFNKDIDYQRTIVDPLTIPFNYVLDNGPSESDEEVLAMANNLYGYDAFEITSPDELVHDPDIDITPTQAAYLDLRAVVAKTKVAENSFNALIAMKSEGTENSARDFLASYLEELGVIPNEIDDFLGENPSYYAQMEILTKTAYQTPLFYTNLYDKPVNVERKGVAMQAINLMQKFDLLKSYLRTEASLSILLELAVIQIQREVEDNIRNFDSDFSSDRQ